ncbi:MAG TPA: phosphonate ABC transporter ATP-binding protein [Lactobacillus sp.]|nr:phosphonate ABC transporter ATP-binding protein [Lactobacillus sp.]
MSEVKSGPIINVKQVSKTFDNGTTGLKNINLTVNKGEFLVIVGLSGAGKSTLMRSLNHLHQVTSGEIEIDGQSISSAKGNQLRHLRREEAMIFQNFNLVKQSTVLRNVLAGRLGYYPTWRSSLGLFKDVDKQRAFKALDRVGLLDKVYQRVDQLSGGQQQRVAVARAFVQNPKIVLADEPTASLDPKTAHLVMDDLQRMNQELGKTVVANLHSVELAREYATRIVGLRAGKLVYDEPISHVTDEGLADIYNGQSAVGEK